MVASQETHSGTTDEIGSGKRNKSPRSVQPLFIEHLRAWGTLGSSGNVEMDKTSSGSQGSLLAHASYCWLVLFSWNWYDLMVPPAWKAASSEKIWVVTGGGAWDGQGRCTCLRFLSRRIEVRVLDLQPHSPGLAKREGFGAENLAKNTQVQAARGSVLCPPETRMAVQTEWGLGREMADTVPRTSGQQGGLKCLVMLHESLHN